MYDHNAKLCTSIRSDVHPSNPVIPAKAGIFFRQQTGELLVIPTSFDFHTPPSPRHGRESGHPRLSSQGLGLANERMKRLAGIKYLSTAILLFSASVHVPTATASQTAAGNICQTVSGLINLSADDGIVLWTVKTSYPINDAPAALEQISFTNLVDGIQGTYKICRTGALDRFGHAVVNIISFANLKFNKTN